MSAGESETNPAAGRELADLVEKLRSAVDEAFPSLWERFPLDWRRELPAGVEAQCAARYRKIRGDVPRGQSPSTARQNSNLTFGEAYREEMEVAGYSEDHLALRFTKANGSDWRYIASRGLWYRWRGHVWQPDRTLDHFDRVRLVCCEAANELRVTSTSKNREKMATLIQSARTVAAVTKLASADRVHAGQLDEWDRDPWLINTPAGIVDLRTGMLQPHRRDAYCTKTTAVGPAGRCPTWMQFLLEVCQGDRRLVAYLQRLAGYALTGSTQEHSMAFLFGLGANGKSTFVNVLTGVLGDYAATAAFTTFLETHGDQHPTDLAQLMGARLVVAQEVEEGRRWATSKVKALTGGDLITARFMRQDFFTYRPTFKLLLAGNHKPALRNVDEAMRRRLHLIPFMWCVPATDRDQHLGDKLRLEWPGILAWAICGCLRWQRLGLFARRQWCGPRLMRTCETRMYLKRGWANVSHESQRRSAAQRRCMSVITVGPSGLGSDSMDSNASASSWRSAAFSANEPLGRTGFGDSSWLAMRSLSWLTSEHGACGLSNLYRRTHACV